MTIGLEKLRDRLLADPEVKAEYDRLGPVYEVVGALIDARHEAGLTQAQVAERMGTKQSVVARLENAHRMPSLDMVARYAAAVGRRVALVPAE
jgi:ribosome-binding protein aMBF1 (putative translation factor)